MRKDHLSLLDGYVTGSEEVGQQTELRRPVQTEILSVVWDRLVKDEGVVQQPWHHRLQFIRYNKS